MNASSSAYPLAMSKGHLAGASRHLDAILQHRWQPFCNDTRCYYFYDAGTPCNKREPGERLPRDVDGLNRIHAITRAQRPLHRRAPVRHVACALAALDATVIVRAVLRDAAHTLRRISSAARQLRQEGWTTLWPIGELGHWAS